MDSVFNFIITEVENENFTSDFYHDCKPLYLGNTGLSLLIHNPAALRFIIQNTKDDFRFRVLIHAEIGDAHEYEKAKGFNTLRMLRQTYPNGKFILITGEENIFASKGNTAFEYVEVKKTKIYYRGDLTRENFFESIDNECINTTSEFLTTHGKSSNKENNLTSTPDKSTRILRPSISILTALTSDEYSSFRENFTRISEDEDSVTGKFQTSDGYDFDYQNSFQIKRQGRMGMVDASLSTLKAFNENDIVIMPGVCGGRASEVKLYDIVIPNNTVDIITGKLENGNFIPYGFSAAPNEKLIDFLSETSRHRKIKERMYSLVSMEKIESRKKDIVHHLKIHFGTLACGAFVLATDNFLEEKAKNMNNKIIGFEMESYGVMRANQFISNPQKVALVVKSVMDFTDSKKKDDMSHEPVKNYAAYMSYLCVRALIPYVDEFYTKYVGKKN